MFFFFIKMKKRFTFAAVYCFLCLICSCDGLSLGQIYNIGNYSHQQSKKNNTILLGVILPYTLSADSVTSITGYSTGTYYASAMFIAMNDINNNSAILPNMTFEVVWGDTECVWNKTLILMEKMNDIGVHAFVGGGCADVERAAKFAEEKNKAFLPLVSLLGFDFLFLFTLFIEILYYNFSCALTFPQENN